MKESQGWHARTDCQRIARRCEEPQSIATHGLHACLSRATQVHTSQTYCCTGADNLAKRGAFNSDGDGPMTQRCHALQLTTQREEFLAGGASYTEVLAKEQNEVVCRSMGRTNTGLLQISCTARVRQ